MHVTSATLLCVSEIVLQILNWSQIIADHELELQTSLTLLKLNLHKPYLRHSEVQISCFL